MYTILVPVDFSPISKNALDYAGFLAKLTKGQIVMVNALHPKMIAVSPNQVFDPTDYESQKNEVKRKLDELALKYRQQHIYTKQVVTLGFLNDVVKEASEEHNPDLIITGTHGAEGIEASLLGTRSMDIAKVTDCPTLIIPQNWKIDNFDKILYATDFKFSDLTHLKQIVDIAKINRTQITVVHLTSPELANDHEALMYWFKELCKEEIDYTNLNFEVVESSDFLSTFEYYVQEKGYDLVCMATQKRNFIESLFSKSLTKEIAFAAKFPLWVINAG